MADAPPLTDVRFLVESGVVFRRQVDGQHPRPTAQLVFGHLRKRWRFFDPASAPDVAFSEIEFKVRLDGWFVTVEGPGRPTQNGRGRRSGSFRVFTGEIGIGVAQATEAERRALGALSRLAEFAGLGAFTTAGFGAVGCVDQSYG